MTQNTKDAGASLSDGQKKQIAAVVHRDCTLIPGANFHTAAELAIQATLAQLSRATTAEQPEATAKLSTETVDKPVDRVGGEVRAEAVRVGSETWNVLRLCITELSGWMRDHGQDLRSQEAVKRARALLAAPASSTGDQA
jgi:hypothetical protein